MAKLFYDPTKTKADGTNAPSELEIFNLLSSCFSLTHWSRLHTNNWKTAQNKII
jgi:hypothetical protein